MNKVQIIVDSSVDLPKEFIKENNFEVVPFHILFGEESFRDGLNITTEEMYARVEKTGSLPKTAAVSPGEWKVYFDKYLAKGLEVFVLTISSKLSSNFQNAYIASQDYEEGKVVICDSLVLSGSVGLLALKAAKLNEAGLSALKINEELLKLVPKVHTQFVIRTLEYLHKGGRCSTLSRFVGAVLSLKVQIKMKDGKLNAYKKTPGKMSRAVDLMLEDFYDLYDADKIDKEIIFITHSIAPLMVEHIKKEFEAREIKPKHLIVSEAGTVISSHCGAGTVGILYLEK